MSYKLFFSAFAAACLVSCTKAAPEALIVPEKSDYTGTVTVIYQEASFDNQDIKVNFEPSDDNLSASLTIHQIRFVPQMPITIDVTVPDISVKSTSEKISLSCEKTVPLAMGGPFPRYTVTNFSGEIRGDELIFSLKFGDYPTSFRGKITR